MRQVNMTGRPSSLSCARSREAWRMGDGYVIVHAGLRILKEGWSWKDRSPSAESGLGRQAARVVGQNENPNHPRTKGPQSKLELRVNRFTQGSYRIDKLTRQPSIANRSVFRPIEIQYRRAPTGVVLPPLRWSAV